MALHLCEIKIRSTGKTIKYYEIETSLSEFTLTGINTAFHIRDQAAEKFRTELAHTPSLRKLLQDPKDWCVDSVVIS